MKNTKLIITCEHATNHIPKEYIDLFKDSAIILNTHEAYDIGANEISDEIAKTLKCKLIKARASRLLIDCNRKLSNPKVFSKFTKRLSNETKQNLIQEIYLPFRIEVENTINKEIENNFQILHLSMHSFTSKLRNKVRKTDIGLLYDPNSHGEKEVSRVLKNFIINDNSDFIVRMNYPYLGKNDGFTTSLRKKHKENDYLGIEIECNQHIVMNKDNLQRLIKTLSCAIKELKDYL